MFMPIKLTRFNEMLVDKRNSNLEEESKLENCIGSHVICGGDIDIHQVSLTHRIIFCFSCQLRVVIPIEVKTYADLREFLSREERAGIQLVLAREVN